MNLRQLKSLCEIVDHGLKISGAAEALYRSQPSISRHIQDLEKELGVDLFYRRRNRLLELTPQGREILSIARRIVQDTENIRRASQEHGEEPAGEFSIATTHTQARYSLPKVIYEFTRQHPRVKLKLRQGTPAQCGELVARGRADIAICTETSELPDDLTVIPCYHIDRSVVTLPGHPLLKVKPLTLKAIARYPIITYDEGFSARSIVDRTFSEAGLEPSVVMSAIDADVSKAYVEMGMGIAILASIAYDAQRDTNLRCMDAKHLFKPSVLSVVVRKNSYLRNYMQTFIGAFAPHVKRAEIEAILSGTRPVGRRAALPSL
jgi:LysR family cys regulon transcriptional activator